MRRPARITTLLALAACASLLSAPAAAAGSAADGAPAAATADGPARTATLPPRPQSPPGPKDLGPPREAQAAARAGGTIRTGATTQASWPSAMVQPGGTEYWKWNNANPLSTVFHVGFRSNAPVSEASACRFQVIRDWYVQQYGGEREYHFVLMNVGTTACSTTIQLAGIAGSLGVPIASATLDPGATTGWGWYNSRRDMSYTVGFSPTGATSGAPCQIEMGYDYYQEMDASDELRYQFNVGNVGSVRCSFDVYLGRVPESLVYTSPAIAPGLPPGYETTMGWEIVGTNDIHLPHVSSSGPSSCSLAVVHTRYTQFYDPGGYVRVAFITVRNISTITCGRLERYGVAILTT